MKKNPAPTFPPGYGPLPADEAAARRPGHSLSAARSSVLEALRAHGRATVADLRPVTHLHGNTLREHLDALARAGLVRRLRGTPAGRGRPAWVYEVVERPPGHPGREYAGLAASLAAHLHRTSRTPWTDAMDAGHAWGHDLAEGRDEPGPGDPAAARRTVLAILEDIGFAPEADDAATSARLTRCPLLETARQYPDVVCGVHLGIVRGALEAHGSDAAQAELLPFAEPGACRLHLST